LFILRLSWGCGREWCCIPHLADFEVIGLYRCDVRIILEALRANNVIFWTEPSNHFAFNKMFDQWNIAKTRNAVHKAPRLKELISQHVKGDLFDPPETLIEMLVNHKRPVCESQTPEENDCMPFTNTPVCESQTPVVSTPATAKEKKERVEKTAAAAGAPPIVPQKDHESTAGKTESPREAEKTWVPLSKNFGAVCTLYEQNIGMLSPILAQELDELATTYELNWIEEAIKEACSMQKRHLKYIAAILARWGVEGYKAPMGKTFKGLQGRPPQGQLLTGDELEQAWKGKGAPSK
jgi:DnaD/phage-associated family protein